MLFCSNSTHVWQADGRTDVGMDAWTDVPSFRDARMAENASKNLLLSILVVVQDQDAEIRVGATSELRPRFWSSSLSSHPPLFHHPWILESTFVPNRDQLHRLENASRLFCPLHRHNFTSFVLLCRLLVGQFLSVFLFERPNILFLDVVEEAFSQLSPAHASSSVWITRLSLAHFRVIDQVCLLSLHSWQATHNWLTPPHSFNSQANYTWVNMNITTLERCQVDGNPAFDSNSFFNLAVLTTQRSSFTFQDRTFRGEFSLQACAIEPYLTVLPFQEEKKTKR